jgi:endogenous inhibitor of DNA gyrase (YacG/DUF329 family)
MTSASNDNGGKAAAPVTPKAAPCPICKRSGVVKYEPFCSKRCADVDLHRWLTGVYAIPAVEGVDDGMLPEEDQPLEP